jgi:hypothetical protein
MMSSNAVRDRLDPVRVARCRGVHDYAAGVFEWAARAHHHGLERSALLVAVSIKSLAIADCQFWVDDKPVPTPYVPSFRSNVIDLDAHRLHSHLQPDRWD